MGGPAGIRHPRQLAGHDIRRLRSGRTRWNTAATSAGRPRNRQVRERVDSSGYDFSANRPSKTWEGSGAGGLSGKRPPRRDTGLDEGGFKSGRILWNTTSHLTGRTRGGQITGRIDSAERGLPAKRAGNMGRRVQRYASPEDGQTRSGRTGHRQIGARVDSLGKDLPSHGVDSWAG